MDNANIRTRTNALYNQVFDIYESLYSLSEEIISVHALSTAHDIQDPVLDSLSDILTNLSLLPDHARSKAMPLQAALGNHVDYIQTQMAKIRSIFAVKSRDVKRARGTYLQLKPALRAAAMVDEGFALAEEKLNSTVENVSKFYEALKVILGGTDAPRPTF